MITTLVLRVDGLRCGSCALLIDTAVEDLPGVRSATTKVKLGRSTIELDTAQTSPSRVVEVIEELGYTAAPLP
ncbi:heavy-metal-associated domain-containing protein [Actinokineospora sp. NPDC004072]